MYKCSPKTYRAKKEFYPLQLKFIFKKGSLSILSPLEIKEMITFASYDELPYLIDFAHLTIDGFPNLDETKFLNSLTHSIEQKCTLILKQQGILIAMMTFAYETGSIGFFAVHPLYRKHRITKFF